MDPTTLELPSTPQDAGPDVWERLWRHRFAPERDDDVIRREARGRRWRRIEAALNETFGRIEGLRTIELGAGRGDLSVLLAARGAKVTILDYSPAALDLARERFERWSLPAEYVQRDLFDAAASGGNGYDVALSLGVVEHFRGANREAAIRAHRLVLRPGGMTVICVPHAACPPYRLWKAYLELRGWWPYGLEIPYSKREMTGLAKAAGFSRWELTCDGFLQSAGDHLCRTFFKCRPRWGDSPCFLDNALGAALTLLAWTADAPAETNR